MPINKDKYYKIDSKDWLDNPAIRQCSCLARSLYMDCLCYMHSNKTRGYLPNLDKLSSVFNLSKQYIDAGFRELVECGLLKQDTENGLLYDSEFRKKSRYSRQQKEFGSRGGNPNLGSDKDCINAKRVNPRCKNASNKECKLAKRDNPICKVATDTNCINAKRVNPIRKNAPDRGITLFANMREDKKDSSNSVATNNNKALNPIDYDCKNATRDNPFCKDASISNSYSYNYTNNYIENNNRSSSSYSNRDCLLVSKDDETQKQKTTTTFDSQVLIEIFDKAFIEVWGSEALAKLRPMPRSTDKTYATKYIKAGLNPELAREIFLEKQQKRKNSNQKPIDSLAYFRAVVPEVINRINNINNQNFELTTRSDSYATGNKNFTSSKTSNYTSKFDQRAEGVFEEISRRRKPVSD